MEAEKTTLKDLLILKPKVFEDDRGFFMESFNKRTFEQVTGVDTEFVQDNHSRSTYGVLRGLHFQKPPYAQAKLIRVIKGKVLDVAVDLRKNSPTFGFSETFELSEQNKLQAFVPRGFAHGFLVLSETAEFLYKVDNWYDKSSEGGIIFNDHELDIDWQIPENDIILSGKDKLLGTFAESKEIFN